MNITKHKYAFAALAAFALAALLPSEADRASSSSCVNGANCKAEMF